MTHLRTSIVVTVLLSWLPSVYGQEETSKTSTSCSQLRSKYHYGYASTYTRIPSPLGGENPIGAYSGKKFMSVRFGGDFKSLRIGVGSFGGWILDIRRMNIDYFWFDQGDYNCLADADMAAWCSEKAIQLLRELTNSDLAYFHPQSYLADSGKRVVDCAKEITAEFLSRLTR